MTKSQKLVWESHKKLQPIKNKWQTSEKSDKLVKKSNKKSQTSEKCHKLVKKKT